MLIRSQRHSDGKDPNPQGNPLFACYGIFVVAGLQSAVCIKHLVRTAVTLTKATLDIVPTISYGANLASELTAPRIVDYGVCKR